MIKASVIQFNAAMNIADILTNLNEKVDKLRSLNKNDSLLVVLPENFLGYPTNVTDVKKLLKQQEELNVLEELRRITQKYSIILVAGTLIEPRKVSNSYYITSYVFENGKLIGKYHKKHLFKAYLSNADYNEAQIFTPGNKSLVINTSIGKIGVCVCFDIRFSEVFSKMRKNGAKILCIPAAFNQETGKKHWEILLRARAIENQSVVIAAGLCGVSPQNLACYGNSMIIDPDGFILAQAKDSKEIQVITSSMDIEKVDKIRRMVCMQ